MLLVKKIINYFLSFIDLIVVKRLNYQNTINLLNKTKKKNDDLSFKILCNYKNNSNRLKKEYKNSRSQSLQDLFVLSYHNFKKKGFFIEVGAYDGIFFSNTYLLEKKFKWSGILAEPSTRHFKSLKSNRKAKIETNLLYSTSNKNLLFIEVLNTKNSSALFSGIDKYSSRDFLSQARKINKKYNVNTISLNDLLVKHNAPKIIDYLSIDTEGSEYEILRTFNFKKYKFKSITVEHNYSKNRHKIYKLLTSNGYKRVLQEISGMDDFYVNI